MTQGEFDFSAKKQRDPARPHHRTTILTVSRKAFEKVMALKQGEQMVVDVVNDIVSSCKAGGDTQHRTSRRYALVSRQFKGGFYKAKVRYDANFCVDCTLLSSPVGEVDDCYFSIVVSKPEVKAA